MNYRSSPLPIFSPESIILMKNFRFFDVRSTYHGKIEEHLPVLAIVLPEKLTKRRRKIRAIVGANADVLTTPFDIYATMLDAMDLTQHWRMDKVKGADYPRSLSIFNPVSCVIFYDYFFIFF